MSIAGTDAERQPKLGRVRGVEVFQVGLRKGKRFTESDLDDAVANFQKFSSGALEDKLIDAAVALGHNAEEVKKNDGLPRYGTIEKLWKEKKACDHCGGSRVYRGLSCGFCDNPDGFPTGTRTILKGDFSDVPQEVGQWIQQKAYTRGSIEFYSQNHPALSAVPVKGISVRRVVLLGADLPAVGSLKPLQSAQLDFSDVLWSSPMRFAEVEERGEMILCFSDVEIDVDPKRKALESLGLTAETIAKMSDSEVEALSKPAAPKVFVFNDMCMADAYRHCSNMGMMVEPSQMTYKDKVHPRETLKAFMPMSDVHRALTKNGYEHHGMGKFVHKSSGHEMHVDHDGENPHIVRYSDKTESDDMNASDLKAIADMVTANLKSEVEAISKATVDGAIKTFSDQFEQTKKEVDSFKLSTHRDAIQTFCDEQLAAGRIFAYEMDDSSGLPTIVDQLCKASTKPEYKFSDAGKDYMLSDLDVAKRDILKRPVRHTEKTKQGDSGRGMSVDSDKARFDTLVATFSDEFENTGFDAEGTWKAMELLSAKERQAQLTELENLAKASREAA